MLVNRLASVGTFGASEGLTYNGNQYKRYQKVKKQLVRSSGKENDLLTNIEEAAKFEQAQKNGSNAGKGFGKPQPKPKKKKPQMQQSSPPAKSSVEASKPFESQLNRTLDTADRFEEAIVRTLALLFIVFFVEGVYLAIAGFLPEKYDDFAVKYVFPAFTPTLGIFLAISVVYGLLKTRQQQK